MNMNKNVITACLLALTLSSASNLLAQADAVPKKVSTTIENDTPSIREVTMSLNLPKSEQGPFQADKKVQVKVGEKLRLFVGDNTTYATAFFDGIYPYKTNPSVYLCPRSSLQRDDREAATQWLHSDEWTSNPILSVTFLELENDAYRPWSQITCDLFSSLRPLVYPPQLPLSTGDSIKEAAFHEVEKETFKKQASIVVFNASSLGTVYVPFVIYKDTGDVHFTVPVEVVAAEAQ